VRIWHWLPPRGLYETLPAMTSFSPTQGEVALVNQIFTKHDPQKLGVITGDVAVNIFKLANLGAATLCQIWQIADADGQGFLTRKGVSVAVRLLGWAQNGEVILGELVNKRECSASSHLETHHLCLSKLALSPS
jgi:hypothetical protein